MFGLEFVASAFLLAILLDQLADKKIEDHLGFSAVYAIFAFIFGLFGSMGVNGTAEFGLNVFYPAISSLAVYWVGVAISRLEKAL